LALAVSLANESFEHLALHELHKWICAHQGRELPEDNPQNQNTSLFNQYGNVTLQREEFARVSLISGKYEYSESPIINLPKNHDAKDYTKA
jgi:hypothetical protein